MSEHEETVLAIEAVDFFMEGFPPNQYWYRIKAELRRLLLVERPHPEEVEALRVAARAYHEAHPGTSVLRAFCACGYHSMGGGLPLCALLRRMK